MGGSFENLTLSFDKRPDKGFEVQRMTFSKGEEESTLRLGMTHEEVISAAPTHSRALYENIAKAQDGRWVVVRDRCFLGLILEPRVRKLSVTSVRLTLGGIESHIRGTIHLPGLRGNPERAYPVTAVGSTFPGTFENYAASVIAQWQADRKSDKLEHLNGDLERLGLTWKVTAKAVNDTQVELQVGRLPQAGKGGTRDLVNIADVGFGVSQILPVLVALHVAEPGQLLYLEQPEIHLHPRAQYMMAQALADAANRGVRVVAETHSSLLLL